MRDARGFKPLVRAWGAMQAVLKGFSERNIKRMLAFHRAYPEPDEIVPQFVAQFAITQKVQQPVAELAASQKVPQPVAQTRGNSLLWHIPWGHHTWLLEKVKDLAARRWYMEQTLANGWSRNVLTPTWRPRSCGTWKRSCWNWGWGSRSPPGRSGSPVRQLDT